MARNTPTNTYSGPPESIPKVSRTFDFRRSFGRFEPGSLSTFFQNPTSKNRKSPLPRGSPWGSKGGVWPPPKRDKEDASTQRGEIGWVGPLPAQIPHLATQAQIRGSRMLLMLGAYCRILGHCFEILNTFSEIQGLDSKIGCLAQSAGCLE